MLGWLRKASKSRRETRRGADALVVSVLAQARLPVFYTAGGVADTITGRFDMIALHAFLVMRAMKREPELAALNQTFLNGLFATIDASFRQMGVSDPRVPRKVRQAAEAFYGRLGAYEKALSGGGFEPLEAALLRNVFGEQAPDEGVLRALASYVIGSMGALAIVGHRAWYEGQISFATPHFGDRP